MAVSLPPNQREPATASESPAGPSVDPLFISVDLPSRSPALTGHPPTPGGKARQSPGRLLRSYPATPRGGRRATPRHGGALFEIRARLCGAALRSARCASRVLARQLSRANPGSSQGPRAQAGLTGWALLPALPGLAMLAMLAMLRPQLPSPGCNSRFSTAVLQAGRGAATNPTAGSSIFRVPIAPIPVPEAERGEDVTPRDATTQAPAARLVQPMGAQGARRCQVPTNQRLPRVAVVRPQPSARGRAG